MLDLPSVQDGSWKAVGPLAGSAGCGPHANLTDTSFEVILNHHSMGYTKVIRHGALVEIARYSRDLIVPSMRSHVFVRAKREAGVKKMRQNIQRARRNVRRMVATAMWSMGTPIFATFTYNEGKAWTPEKALKDWAAFTRRMAKVWPDAMYIRVFEKHKKGDIHIHAIFFGIPSHLPCTMQPKTGRHICPKANKCEWRTGSLRKLWGHGHVRLEWTNSPEKAAAYLSKYIMKAHEEGDWEMFGRHAYSINYAYRTFMAKARAIGVVAEWSTHLDGSGVIADRAAEMESVATEVGYSNTFSTAWLGECSFRTVLLPEDYKTVWIPRPPRVPRSEAPWENIIDERPGPDMRPRLFGNKSDLE